MAGVAVAASLGPGGVAVMASYDPATVDIDPGARRVKARLVDVPPRWRLRARNVQVYMRQNTRGRWYVNHVRVVAWPFQKSFRHHPWPDWLAPVVEDLAERWRAQAGGRP